MAVSAVFFLDVKGRVIVHRDYRGDISPKYADKFMAKINELEENARLTPVIYDEGGVSYVYLQVNGKAQGQAPEGGELRGSLSIEEHLWGRGKHT